jgi:hypothetical protein
MDQDIMFQVPIAFAAGALTTYFQLPYRCTMRNIKGIVQADPGDDETVTVTYGTTVAGATIAIGVLTFGNDIAAGAVGTWVADATTGETVMAKDGYLKFVTSAAATAVCDLNIELDPYAR